MNPRIYLSPPHLGEYEQQFILDAIASNWIAPVGPSVDAFEREVAEYAGIKGTLALVSGTAAIHLALKLLGVEAGDRVFCSALTFVASANPILYERAEPVFIDSEPETWNMSPFALERALLDADRNGKLPKALIIVNLYGQNADMTPLLGLCEQYDIPVIEDAAESLGATYNGKVSGVWGKFGAYSFNGNKIITASSGGMLLSDDLDAMEKALYWATQSKDPARHYQHSEVGYSYRLSNILAAIGRAQFKVLPERIEARRRVFECYYDALSTIDGIEFMPEASYGRSTRWLTALTVNPAECGTTPNELMDALAQENIEARPVWKPLHLQPLFQGALFYPHKHEERVSERLFEHGMCLPSGSNLSEAEQERVIRCLMKTLRG